MMPPISTFAVANRIDVDLDRLIEKAVQQNRAVIRRHQQPLLCRSLNHLHCARLPWRAHQHIGRPHDQRKADFSRHHYGFIFRTGNTIWRLLEIQALQKLLESFTVLGQIDRVRGGTDNRRAGMFECPREL